MIYVRYIPQLGSIPKSYKKKISVWFNVYTLIKEDPPNHIQDPGTSQGIFLN